IPRSDDTGTPSGRRRATFVRILERVRAGSGVDREASYGLQAGLLAIGLIGITLATFGPFFFLSLAYVLMAAAGAIALLGWRCALVISLVLPALLLIPNHVVAFCEILEPPSSFPTQVNGTQVEIRLTEGFARVVIIKEFYNPSSEAKQGQIFFPLEKGHELIT